MSAEIGRELTTLEYIVLGLIGYTPQTGYSILGALENNTSRWSSSPGSVYPILKRLESQGFIAGELEIIHETRPRKVYRLTPLGETTLDTWLRTQLDVREVLDRRDIALIKFLFAEKRLPRAEIIKWLDDYEKLTDAYDAQRRIFFEMALTAPSLHSQLIQEATMLELNMQRTWIQLARRRLEADSR